MWNFFRGELLGQGAAVKQGLVVFRRRRFCFATRRHHRFQKRFSNVLNMDYADYYPPGNRVENS